MPPDPLASPARWLFYVKRAAAFDGNDQGPLSSSLAVAAQLVRPSLPGLRRCVWCQTSTMPPCAGLSAGEAIDGQTSPSAIQRAYRRVGDPWLLRPAPV